MPAVPKHIGRYPVARLLGSGAMGSVYLGRDTELDRDVAIKTVHPRLIEHADSADILERLRNEARAVARVKHASIVEVYDVGTDEQVGPFLVFEYVEGKSLKQLLAEGGPLSPSLVVALAEQVGEALARAHAAGIIHRDIKPENLLVGGDGRTRLLDFGVARLPDAVLTGEGQFLGTPAYAAPETLARGDYSPASDQFSLSVVLFEVITGRRAFLGDDALAVAHAVIHEQPPRASEVAPRGVEVSPELDAVIARGMAKQPDQRFESVPSLVTALRAAYAGEGVDVHAYADTLPQGPAPGRTADSRRGSWALFVTTAGALLIGSLIVLRFVPGTVVGAEGQVQERDAGQEQTALNAAGDSPVDADSLGEAGVGDGAVDAGGDAGDGGTLPDVEGLSAFEREERAKDALDRARDALRRGDTHAAQQALDEATLYDPEHPDIALLQRRVRTL